MFDNTLTTIRGLTNMNTKKWKKLNIIEKLDYVSKNEKEFIVTVDGEYMQLAFVDNSIKCDLVDFGIRDFLTLLKIKYEEV